MSRIESLKPFAVPLELVHDFVPAGALPELATWILSERERDPGLERSNAGGWHSRPDLPVRGVPVLDRLFQALADHVGRMHARLGDADAEGSSHIRVALQAWATVMEDGHFVHVHDHADAHWSAVVYVDSGDTAAAGNEDVGGRIAWLNPIGPHRALPGADLTPTSFELRPRAGLLVVFPGWLRHLVQPYRGARPRICIAANIEVRHA